MYKKYKITSYPIIIAILVIHFTGMAQTNSISQEVSTISIEECYQWSRENYPLIKQMDIIDKTTQFNLSNASNGNLPQIKLNGQATYQSAVTKLPIEIPNMEIPTIDKDQYKIYGELYQPLTNFSNVRANKSIISSNGEIEKQQVEVNLYHLKERINQMYFGVLLINEKIEQYQIIQSDIENAMAKIEAAIDNGTATITDKQLLKVEHISLAQQIEENRANQLAFLNMLSVLTGKNILAATALTKPAHNVIPTTINRPELQLFNLQKQTIKLQKKLLSNSLLPNLGLFVQGGYGRPALNFLSNDFDFYYLGGIKFNWNISSIYGYKNTKNILDLSRDKIENQKEAFLLNTNLTTSQQSAEVSKYQNTIKSDNEIIKIREEVLATANVQLTNGLITTLDYVKFLNDVNKARQVFVLHETQLLLAQFNLKTTTGN
jgi:outer membrane protein TolC